MNNYIGSGWAATTQNGQPFSPYQQEFEARWIAQFGDPKMWSANSSVPPPPSFTGSLSVNDLGNYLEYDPVNHSAFLPRDAYELGTPPFQRISDGAGHEANFQTYDQYRQEQGLAPIDGDAGAYPYGAMTGYWGQGDWLNAQIVSEAGSTRFAPGVPSTGTTATPVTALTGTAEVLRRLGISSAPVTTVPPSTVSIPPGTAPSLMAPVNIAGFQVSPVVLGVAGVAAYFLFFRK